MHITKRSRLTDAENKPVITGGGKDGGGAIQGWGLRGTNYYVYNKLQGSIAQHMEYIQYLIIIIKGV